MKTKSPTTLNYPEIESRGYKDAKRNRPNPYARFTDHHAAWELGARQHREMDRKISEELMGADFAPVHYAAA